MQKITKYLLIIGMGALWCPLLAQVTETITIEGIHNSLYKDVETGDITATGSGYDIGRYLETSGAGSTLDTTLNDISRTYYAFDVEDVLSANNVTIHSVKLFYRTIKSGESNFKITNTESFTKGINDLSENERGTYYNSIGNSSVLHQGLTYNGNGAIDSLTSVPIRTLLTSDLSKKVLYLGAFSQNESTDSSETSLILELKINYTYTAYNVTIRNDFNGSPNGGKVKASKNSAALVEYDAPYEIAVVNKDTINMGAKDNQVNGSFTWVFNDAEPENKSRWMYDDSEDITPKSNDRTTSHIANNDQNSTLYAEMKKLYNVIRQDQTELGTFTGHTYQDVVEGNTRNITAPPTKSVSGKTLNFAGWGDVSTTSTSRTVTPTGHTDYPALYKGSQISNNANTFKANQRKVVRSRDGWEHMVYESMGHIWYEAKAPGGDWELVERQGNLHIDSNGGKSPSIDFNTYESPNPYMTVVSWQEGIYIYYQVFAYASGEYIPYNWDYFTHGESSSANVKPNVTFTDNGEFAIFWKSSSGINYKIFDFDSPSNPVYDDIASGTISSTTEATNIAVSSSSNGTNDYFGIAWQEPMDEISGSPYYYGDEIKFVALRHIANASTATKIISNMRISNSSVVRNKEPSIVNMESGRFIVGWVSGITTNSTWGDPFDTKATFAILKPNPWGVYVAYRPSFSYYVNSVSVNKLSDNSNFYVGWSQIFDDPSWTDRNYLIDSTYYSNYKFTNTQGEDVQLTEASSENNMHLFSYNRSSLPYFWNKSNSVGSYFKVKPKRPIWNRGIVLTDTSTLTTVKLEIGAITKGEEPIGFRPMDSGKLSKDEIERFVQMDIFTNQYAGIEDVAPYLMSNTFEFSEESVLNFSEKLSVIPFTEQNEHPTKDSFITFKVSLVDAKSGKKMALLREITISPHTGAKEEIKAWAVPNNNVGNTQVYIQMDIETNITGLIAEMEDSFIDEYGQSKVSAQSVNELEITLMEEITEYALTQNYPNPFNPTTQIEYQIPEAGLVRLEVFDLLGRKVSTLVNDHKDIGTYSVTFDASALASGMYVYTLSSGNFTTSQKMFLIK